MGTIATRYPALTRDLIMLFSPIPAFGVGALIEALASPEPLSKWQALCFAPFAICCIAALLAMSVGVGA